MYSPLVYSALFLSVLCCVRPVCIQAVDIIELPQSGSEASESKSLNNTSRNNSIKDTDLTDVSNNEEATTKGSFDSVDLETVSLMPTFDATLDPFNISEEFNITDNLNDTDLTNSTDFYNTTDTPEEDDGNTGAPDDEAWLSRGDSNFVDYCPCDIKAAACDVGCCCDGDCTRDDRRAFRTCTNLPRRRKGGGRWCYQQWVVQRHSAEYTEHRTEPGLFCLYVDNNPYNTRYSPVKPLISLDQFDAVRRSALSRSSPAAPQHPARPPASVYRQGAPVWALGQAGQLFQLGLPARLFSSTCGSVSKMSYLQDLHTSCWRHLASRDAAFTAHTYVNFLVLTRPPSLLEEDPVTTVGPSDDTAIVDNTSPLDVDTTDDTSAETSTAPADVDTNSTSTSTTSSNSKQNITPETINETSISNFTDKPKLLANLLSSNESTWLNNNQDGDTYNASHLIKVQTILCERGELRGREEEKEELCSHVKDTDSLATLDPELRVSKVEYIVYHNGTSGIKAMTAKIHVVHMEQEHGSIQQTFSLIYRWVTKETIGATGNNIFERSGRPGYKKGKPLLWGQLVKNTTEDGETLEAISSDPALGLSILRGGPASSSLCSMRQPITFGVNLKSVCSIHVSRIDITDNCDALRSAITDLLLGPLLKEVDEFRVASYGDSDVMRPAEWVPLLRTSAARPEDYDEPPDLSEEGRCPDLVLSLQLEVAYALQGSFSNPQPRIIGVLLTTGVPQLSPSTLCIGVLCSAAHINIENEHKTRLFDINNLTSWEFSDDASKSDSTTWNYDTQEGRTVELELSSSVIFLDMTEPSEPLLPELPSIDLKLPYDFFYPYLPSSTVCTSVPSHCMFAYIALSLFPLLRWFVFY